MAGKTPSKPGLAHLAPAIRPLAALSDEERRRYILSDRWTSYPLAVQTLRRIEELLNRPRVSRMRSLLIHGDSGMGKTVIRRKLERDYTDGFPVGEGRLLRPLVSMQLPSRPDERRFYAHLLDALGAPPRPRDTLDQIEVSALRLLRHLAPAAILLDEFQHIGSADARNAQGLLNLIKFLSNELSTPVIAFGTDAALNVIKTDRQIDSRFYKHALPIWGDTEAFADLVASIIAALPLRTPSDAGDRTLVHTLLTHSEGITGEVFHLLTTAAVEALGAEERITIESVERAALGGWRAVG